MTKLAPIEELAERENFRNWFTSNQYKAIPESDFESFTQDIMFYAWKAARAIDAKRIAELEALANRPVTDNTQLIANMEAQITELQAEIARLNAIT